MRESKRPSIPAPKRTNAPRPSSSRSVPPPADLTKRVADCEAEIRTLRAELDGLRRQLARRVPPPLPDEGDDVIAIDASEVVLESIRPPGPRRHGR